MNINELEEQKSKIYTRMKEVRGIIDSATDPDERRKQQERLRILREMYRDACDQLEAARPPQEKRRKTQPRKIFSTDALSWDFFERCGVVWSDIEGRTWSALEDAAEAGTAREAATLLAALRNAIGSLTENQRETVMALYSRGMTVESLAAERGVNPSTVSRTAKTALRRLERCILASLQAVKCAGPDGFDFLNFAEATNVLTERQREYLYFLLTDGASLGEIARYLDLERSTMSHGSDRLEANLAAVRPGLGNAKAARKVDKSEWSNKSEKEIAEALGITPAAYYRHCCRNETVGGITRIAYEVLRMGDIPAKEAAQRLGIGVNTVRKYRKRYAGVDVSDWDEPERYTPRKRRRDPSNLRCLLSDTGGNTIADCVDADTYKKMLAIGQQRKE